MLLRFFDICFSTAALLILSPLLLLVVIILRLTGEGEIFFFQERVGLKGELFKLFKFATMLKNSPTIGTGTVTLHNDPRILPFGSFLRKSKINELPQLINVLKGEMSIIGPRPQTARCFKAFPHSCQLEILKVLPGLSGIGSIIFRNEEKMLLSKNDADEFYDNSIMPYKGVLEAWYVQKQSISSYFILIFLTVWVVLGLNKRAAWLVFRDLPKPPSDLKVWI